MTNLTYLVFGNAYCNVVFVIRMNSPSNAN